MYTIDNFIKDLHKINNLSEIELELKLLLDKQYSKGKLVNNGYTNEEVKILFKSLFILLNTKYSFSEKQLVNLISNDGFNKQFEFDHGEKILDSKIMYIKNKIKDQYLPFDGMSWKLKACREKIVHNEERGAYKIIRFKRRYSAEFCSNWRIDYTFIIFFF